MLTVGAGEAFQEDRAARMPGGGRIDPTLQNHMDAGRALRITMILLTLVACRDGSLRERWPSGGSRWACGC